MRQKVTVLYVPKTVSAPLSCELQNAERGPSTVGADAHIHKWRCPHVRIPCPHSARGCSSIIPRSDLEAHLSTCPFEAFSGFFEMNDARLKSLTFRAERLEEELDRMREHLKRMEGNVEGLGHMRRETGDDWRWREAGLMRLGDTPSPAIPSNDNPNSQIPPIFSSSPSTPTPSHPSPQPSISSVPPSTGVLSSGGARPDSLIIINVFLLRHPLGLTSHMLTGHSASYQGMQAI